MRQAAWIWARIDSRHSAFSYADMRLLCRASKWLRTVVYFFSSDCRSACRSEAGLESARLAGLEH